MLVLSRKKNESIIINDNITVTVIEIRGDKVRLGIEAPKHVTVHRREVYEAIQNQARALDQESKVGRSEADRVVRSWLAGQGGLPPRSAPACELLFHALDDTDEFLHPWSIVGPSSDCHQGAINDHLLIQKLGPGLPAGRVRGRGNTSFSGLSYRPPPAAAADRGNSPRSACRRSTKWRTMATALGRFLKYSGARPPGNTSPWYSSGDDFVEPQVGLHAIARLLGVGVEARLEVVDDRVEDLFLRGRDVNLPTLLFETELGIVDFLSFPGIARQQQNLHHHDGPSPRGVRAMSALRDSR